VACQLGGAAVILAGISEALGAKVGETSPDGRVSLLKARCLGVCDLAPVAVVDGELHAKVEIARLLDLLRAGLGDCP
jgi:bidirectional [NiFe] hydrogenase diaphorase subunit